MTRRTNRQEELPWSIRYFRRRRTDDPVRTVPAREFLRSCPDGVRADIYATLKAVAEAPPPRFSGGGRWQAMHGQMKGFYEVRVMGPGRALFRLFCLLDRDQRGLTGPSIVLITGMSKAHGTSFSRRDYAKVRALADEYRAGSPRSVI